MSRYLKIYWAVVKWRDRLPTHRRTWCYIGATVLLALATAGSLLLLNRHDNPAVSKCYAEGAFSGLSVYLESDHTTLQSCASAAKGAKLTSLPSLPPGLQQVCTGTNGVTVYMKPDELTLVRNLGINPEVICS